MMRVNMKMEMKTDENLDSDLSEGAKSLISAGPLEK